jgi:hypothetical protein
MAGLTEFYCGWNEPSHASEFKWLEYTFKVTGSKYWNRSNTRVAEVKRNLKTSIQMFSMNKGSSSTIVIDITLKVSCFENIAESYVM